MIVYHLRFERIVLLVFPHTEMLLNRNQHQSTQYTAQANTEENFTNN